MYLVWAEIASLGHPIYIAHVESSINFGWSQLFNATTYMVMHFRMCSSDHKPAAHHFFGQQKNAKHANAADEQMNCASCTKLEQQVHNFLQAEIIASASSLCSPCRLQYQLWVVTTFQRIKINGNELENVLF